MVKLRSRGRGNPLPRCFILPAHGAVRGNCLGQQTPAPAVEPGIQDNSFLVEEAYNQNYGVVQHISSFTRFWSSKDWNYSFTQEWPVPGDERHQLSYTLVAAHSGDFPGSGVGIGDVLLNYRYQLVGSGDTRLAFSPRLSLILPAGDSMPGTRRRQFRSADRPSPERCSQQETGQSLECGRHVFPARPGRFGRPCFIRRLQPGAELYLAGAYSLQCHAGNCVCPVTGRRGHRSTRSGRTRSSSVPAFAGPTTSKMVCRLFLESVCRWE